MVDKIKTRYCLRCGRPSKREHPYLCNKCTFINDYWGIAFVRAAGHGILKAEKYQAERQKAGSHSPLEIGLFYKIMGVAKRGTDGKNDVSVDIIVKDNIA